MDRFKLVSPYKPTGDQPEAIEALVNGINSGAREQTLMGVTGSGRVGNSVILKTHFFIHFYLGLQTSQN